MTASSEVGGDAGANYFDNLLPDNHRIRERLSRRFKAKSADAFLLLHAIGRDCVGAVQLLPKDTALTGCNRVDCEPLDDRQIAETLRAVPSNVGPVSLRQADNDLLRISIAGAQEKTALTLARGRWCRSHGAAPTTHIFKLPLGWVGGSRPVELARRPAVRGGHAHRVRRQPALAGRHAGLQAGASHAIGAVRHRLPGGYACQPGVLPARLAPLAGRWPVATNLKTPLMSRHLSASAAPLCAATLAGPDTLRISGVFGADRTDFESGAAGCRIEAQTVAPFQERGK